MRETARVENLQVGIFFFWEKLREFTESIDNLFVTLFFILSVLIRQFAK